MVIIIVWFWEDIESIQALISIAQSDGNYIVDSWTQVQRCVSFLDRIHIYGVIALEDVKYLLFLLAFVFLLTVCLLQYCQRRKRER